MTLLSTPLTELKPHYDVIVIGSGYGGSIAASRLARATKADGSRVSVCLLERGREIPVGQFPATLDDARAQIQVDTKLGHLGDDMGLYDFRQNEDITVFQGCGLGGTSLVNANVSLRVEEWIWDDPSWPQAIRADKGSVDAGYQRAEAMLRPMRHPDPDTLPKYVAHKKSASAMGHADAFDLTPINVSFETGLNPVGVHQQGCNGCGDCVTGCNVGSKNTLMMNYLPDARNWGAEIFCGVGVRRVARDGDRTLVYYQPLEAKRDTFDAPELFVSGDVVVISAGALGSSEITLRSKSAGLPCSDHVGDRFTGNGDVLGFGYNTDQTIRGIGMGKRDFKPAEQVGPCITSVIDLRRSFANPEDGFVIEEGSAPGPIAPILAPALKLAADLTGKDTDHGALDKIQEEAREWLSLPPGGAYRGATANTQIYLIMSHDDGAGRIALDNDRVYVQWPELGQQEVFKRANAALYDATKALGGTYVASPTFNKAFGYDLVTVHPLGGCCMGDDAASAVVNHKGQLFAGNAGDGVHDNVYVMDGSILPRPLGVNPLFTISAISERNVYLLAEDRGWTISEEARAGQAKFDGSWQPDDKLRVRFTEKMAGHCSTTVLDDYEQADADGKAKDQDCAFVLTIICEDLERMIADPDHGAASIGTVECPVLSSTPMTVSNGRFNLFSIAEDDSALKKMKYRFTLTTSDDRRFFFDGFKNIKADGGADVWDDTTTLFITIYAGEDDSAPVAAKGKLYIAKDDFLKQMTTMVATNSEGKTAVQGTAKFGNFFAGELWDTYGVGALKV